MEWILIIVGMLGLIGFVACFHKVVLPMALDRDDPPPDLPPEHEDEKTPTSWGSGRWGR